MIKEFDYVIVGAGSAGCVLANRLSVDPGVRVLLLEAGRSDASLFIRMPLMFFLLGDKGNRFDWDYETVPQKHCNGRRLDILRGKTLGGSSSTNGMVYLRGHPLDYDRWESEGAAGWSYADVLPYFKRMECFSTGGDEYRGADGPLAVSHAKSEPLWGPLYQAFHDAARQTGYPASSDLNGYQQEGVGWLDATLAGGIRQSSAQAYLRPVLNRPNLMILTAAESERILVENGRAVGIVYRKKGKYHEVRSGREVILCGGAVNSPRLLMLSGIGPADELQQHDIAVVRDLPGVGRNLQDHPGLHFAWESNRAADTLNRFVWPHRAAWAGLKWLIAKKGVCGAANVGIAAMLRSEAGVQHPDIQLMFAPVLMNEGPVPSPFTGGFFVIGSILRPSSRGSIKLQSNNPGDQPLIDPNYLDTEEDRSKLRRLIDMTREIINQQAFDPYRKREIVPGDESLPGLDVDNYVRESVDSIAHLCGSCRMGTDDQAVVDSQLRVRGVEGLRVADASVMPSLISGTTNPPSIMIGEKAADHILGGHMLKPLAPSYFLNPNWQMQQR